MILLIDNYDSFTYNLTDYFARLGEDSLVIKNDAIRASGLKSLKFDKVVISPGPNTPAEAGNLMELIEAVYKDYPILGICLGHQALGCFFGAELVHAQKPMHGKVSQLLHNGKDIYSGLPENFNICRYHSLVLKSLDGTELLQTATCADGECMSFKHSELPITGIQYHPEAILTEYGLDILANWLKTTSA